MNPIDAIKQAVGLQPKIVSPLPQNKQAGPLDGITQALTHLFSNTTSMKLAPKFDPQTQSAIDRYRKYVPNSNNKINDNQIADLYKQHGENMFSQVEPQAPHPLQHVVQQVLGLQAQAQEPQANPTPAPDANDFEKMATPILNQYHIPLSVAFGMRDAEGGKIGTNNAFNINAVDSNPNAATNYANPQDAVKAYAELIAKNPRYAQAYNDRTNPAKMVVDIQNAGYAGPPETWKQRSIKTGGAGKMFNSYADFVQNTPGFKRYSE